MNKFYESLASMAWAMEAQALRRFLAHLAGITDAQIEHTYRAITEKPELLARLQARSGNAAANTRRRASDVTERDLDIRNGVAHIPIAGPMMKQVPSILNFMGIEATSTEAVREMLGAALDSDRVESIVLDIDSPGGTVDGTDALAGDVFALRGLKPTTARVNDLMASAALWVGSQAEHVEIGHTAAVGSIGTVAAVDDRSRHFENKGIKTHVVSSGELKGAFIDGAPVTEAQLEDLQRTIDTYTDLFIEAVARGRGKSQAEIGELATGQMWIGAEAVERGLADSVDSIEDGGSIDITINPDAPARAKVRGSYAAGLIDAIKSTGPLGVDGTITVEADPGDLEDLQIETTAARAAQQEQTTMTDQERKELEQLRADNAALRLKEEERAAAAEQARVEAEARASARKEALLTEYADRFPSPEVRASVAETLKAMAPEVAESYLKTLPKITRDDRQSTSDVVEGALEMAQHGQKVTVEERSLGKAFGQSPERVRDMLAIGGAVERVEYQREEVNGKIQMTPIAVMKDGRRLKRDEMRSALGLKGALACLVLMIGMLFAGNAEAAALTSERNTQCRLSGITKAYLMTASNTIYAGSLVMIDSAGTVVAAAAAASNNNVAGVAQETKTSAATGSTWVRVSDGVICKFAGTTLGQDDVGSLVYAEDDQTVDETAGANEPVAGILIQYVSASVGWVYVNSAYNFGRVATVADPTTLSGDLTLGGGAGALTFSDSASSVVMPDNDATALAMGSTGLLNALNFDTTDDAENVVHNGGFSGAAVSITGATTLDYSNCGKTHFVTAGIDTASITLPPLATVTTGCELTFAYVGADGGALLDISPNASDGIEGTCTLAASIVTFSGTDDADIGLTKATGLQGDMITLVAGNAADWYSTACQGIWANN